MNIFHLCLANNFNAGDIALRDAAQQELIKHFPKAKFTVVDLSRVEWTIASIDYLNQNADLIILGPGGVFLKPHKGNAQWLWDISAEMLDRLRVPIFAYSVGYNVFNGQDEFNEDFKKILSVLLSKSLFFTLRHKGGVRALANYVNDKQQDKLEFNFCPTLVYPTIKSKDDFSKNNRNVAILCAGDRLRLRHKKMREFGQQISQLVQKLKQNNYSVTLLTHMKGDDWIEHYCKEFDAKIDLAGQKTQMIYDTYKKFDYVIGDRGHCQMIAYASGCRVVVPVSHNKLRWFFEDIEMAKYAIDEDDDQLSYKIYDLLQSIEDQEWYDHYASQMQRFRNISEDCFAQLKESLDDA